MRDATALGLALISGVFLVCCGGVAKTHEITVANGEPQHFEVKGFTYKQVFELIEEESGLDIQIESVPEGRVEMSISGSGSWDNLLKSIASSHRELEIEKTGERSYVVK